MKGIKTLSLLTVKPPGSPGLQRHTAVGAEAGWRSHLLASTFRILPDEPRPPDCCLFLTCGIPVELGPGLQPVLPGRNRTFSWPPHQGGGSDQLQQCFPQMAFLLINHRNSPLGLQEMLTRTPKCSGPHGSSFSCKYPRLGLDITKGWVAAGSRSGP